ncbi:TerB family tellurite resistance protein [Salinarimonas chemoclinalis]|uniref:TerB family tellurite resistance protein n=1 Tax=Salinarimonas chemoclinalis TaxID=3241599 RepID=UPI00355700DE
MAMSVWGKLGGLGIGFLIGGPIGALIGAVLGHVLVDREGALFGPTPKDVVFTTGLVALAAKMAKADGVVMRSEREAFRRIVEVDEADRARVEALFDLASRTADGYDSYALQMRELLADEPALLEDVLDGLFLIAAADGAVHEREFAFLGDVARIFGFDAARFERVAARHLALEDDPYAVLGATREMDDAALKAQWRRLVAEIHPDRAVARGLPPEAIAIATRRLAAVNAAWDRIARERGIG